MDSENRANVFLEHYGVKGMKKPVPPQKLDRVYRVAAGTAALKDRIITARNTKAKAVAVIQKQAKKVADAQAKALLEKASIVPVTTKGQDTTDTKEDTVDGESEAKKLLEKCGANKMSDLG
jgi:hypothetical protein